MSKLVHRLEQIEKGGVQPLGFGTAANRERVPGLLFMGALSQSYAAGARALAGGKADAAVLCATNENATELMEARQALANTPWGMWVAQPTQERMDDLKKVGCDFVVFESEQVTIEALADDAMARVMVIRSDLDDRSLRALDGLPVDALLVRLPESASPINLKHMLQLGVVRSMTSGYLLLEHSALPSPSEMEALRELGVDGVVVDISSTSAEEVDHFRRQLLDMPQRRQKGERHMASLSNVYGRLGAPRHEEEEEDDDDP